LTIHRDASQEGKVISNQWIFKKFLLGHKVKQWSDDKADHRNIGPVLVLGENDHRPLIGKGLLFLSLNPIKDGKNDMGNPSGHGVDKGISSHPHSLCAMR
jgi:hypothetical protein